MLSLRFAALTSGFRIYAYWNQQITSERRKDQDKIYK